MRLKKFVPKVIRRPIGMTFVYFKRLRIWINILRQVKGKNKNDRIILRRAFLRAPITALSKLEKWQDPQVDENCTVIVPEVGEFQVRAFSDDLYHVLPAREVEVYQAIIKELGEGDMFVDAGANIGFYTVLASHLVGNTGRVLAVEMMPDTAKVLRNHLKINGCENVNVIEKALSNKTGQVIPAQVEPGKYGQASIARKNDGKIINVKTTTLKTILAGYKSVKLIKMDLEEAEALALTGAGDRINSFKIVIFEARAGRSEAHTILQKQGFRFKNLGGADVIAYKK